MIPLKDVKIRDEMTTGIITVRMDAPLREVIDTMAEKDVSSLVVVYPNGTGAGVISSFDIVKTLLEKPIWRIKALTAGDVMSDVIIEVDPEKTVGEALKLMIEKNVHRVVVLSSSQAGSKPVGILSATDIVKKLRGL
jgi:predicted transcriptional regulator